MTLQQANERIKQLEAKVKQKEDNEKTLLAWLQVQYDENHDKYSDDDNYKGGLAQGYSETIGFINNQNG